MGRRRVLKRANEEDIDAVAGLPSRLTCGTPTLTLCRCARIRGDAYARQQVLIGADAMAMNLEVA